MHALITGSGARGGIGFAIAERFAREGASLILTGRDANRGAEALRRLGDVAGGARFVQADLACEAEVRRLADAAADVDVLVNNAAALSRSATGPADPGRFDAEFAVNVRAPYLLTAALAPRMAARNGGAIVNLSSVAAARSEPDIALYAASKAALESLTRSWALEFAAGGVRVNTVTPGLTSSAKIASVLGPAVGQLGQSVPLGRAARVDEIAEAVLFLAGSRASYITGANLVVDGGSSAAP